MNECIGGPVEEFAERYLNGSLPEAEAEAFEAHYFACDTCHEFLLALKDVQASLEAAPRSMEATEPTAQPLRIVSRNGGKPVQLGTPRRFIAWGSIAAAILVAVVLTTMALNRHGMLHESAANLPPSPEQQERPAGPTGPLPDKSAPAPKGGTSGAEANHNVQMASLADLQIPGYQASHLRGSESTEAADLSFEGAMRSYAQGNCPAALNQFGHVPDGSKHGVAARLYGGLCHFKAHELSQAQSSFEAVIAAGDTPQLESAEYYLAQTMLLRSDAATARLWLRRTVSLHGDYQARAQAQLGRLVHIARQTWNVP
jgi:hypothetical protein